jgi:hypothetical protein
LVQKEILAGRTHATEEKLRKLWSFEEQAHASCSFMKMIFMTRLLIAADRADAGLPIANDCTQHQAGCVRFRPEADDGRCDSNRRSAVHAGSQ